MSLVAQDDESNIALASVLTAVAGVIVLMLAILLIAVAMIAYKTTKWHHGTKGVYNFHG